MPLKWPVRSLAITDDRFLGQFRSGMNGLLKGWSKILRLATAFASSEVTMRGWFKSRASLASMSAHSFPSIPTWAGIHWSVHGKLIWLSIIFMPCVRFVSPLQMASRADFESEKITRPSVRSSGYWEMQKDRTSLIAINSLVKFDAIRPVGILSSVLTPEGGWKVCPHRLY